MTDFQAPHIPMQWFSGRVLHGDKIGRTIGYPTLNFDASIFEVSTSSDSKNIGELLTRGVYAASIKIDEKHYRGALFFGPRVVKDETHDVVEIYVLDFQNSIYNKEVSFQLKAFIRPNKNFDSLESLQTQIASDIATINSYFSS